MRKFFKLKHAGYAVHISYPSKSSAPRVKGTLYDAEGLPVSGVKPITRKAKSKKEIEFLEKQIVNAFEEKLKPKAPRAKKKDDEQMGAIDPRLLEALNAVIESKVLYEDWAKSTVEKYLAKFKKYILPAISPPEEFGHKKKVELEEFIKESLEKKARKDNQLNGRKYAQVYLHAGQVIYELMQNVDTTLPNLMLEADSMRVSMKRSEQPKHIPIEVQVRFERRVMELMYDEPVLARGIVAFHSGATRSSEAASIIYNDVIYNEGYTLLDISTQEINGERNQDLKTPAAYRKVVLDCWGEHIIEETKDIIGYSEDTKVAPISAKTLSKRIKNLLIECGLEEEFIKMATLDMEQYPDYGPDGKPIKEVTSYILRRNRAGIWGNYCGLPDAAIDYMLGHKRQHEDDVALFDEKDPKSFERIAQKIKAINFLEELKECSVTKVSIDNGRAEIPSTPIVQVENNTDEPKEIKIFITSTEPGDAIKISVDGEIKICSITSQKHTTRPKESLIGTVEEGD